MSSRSARNLNPSFHADLWDLIIRPVSSADVEIVNATEFVDTPSTGGTAAASMLSSNMEIVNGMPPFTVSATGPGVPPGLSFSVTDRTITARFPRGMLGTYSFTVLASVRYRALWPN